MGIRWPIPRLANNTRWGFESVVFSMSKNIQVARKEWRTEEREIVGIVMATISVVMPFIQGVESRSTPFVRRKVTKKTVVAQLLRF